MKTKAVVTMTVNGEEQEVAFAPHKTLLEVLREDLGLMGTKHGCELGECGACVAVVDGRPLLSCLLLGQECDGAAVDTIEALGGDARLHPLQEAFADLGGAQCGYCTPGFLLTAKALLDAKPDASRDEIREALSGNLCRCTGYLQIYEAVEAAATKMAPRRANVAEGDGSRARSARSARGREGSRGGLGAKPPRRKKARA